MPFLFSALIQKLILSVPNEPSLARVRGKVASLILFFLLCVRIKLKTPLYIIQVIHSLEMTIFDYNDRVRIGALANLTEFAIWDSKW